MPEVNEKSFEAKQTACVLLLRKSATVLDLLADKMVVAPTIEEMYALLVMYVDVSASVARELFPDGSLLPKDVELEPVHRSGNTGITKVWKLDENEKDGRVFRGQFPDRADAELFARSIGATKLEPGR